MKEPTIMWVAVAGPPLVVAAPVAVAAPVGVAVAVALEKQKKL